MSEWLRVIGRYQPAFFCTVRVFCGVRGGNGIYEGKKISPPEERILSRGAALYAML